MRHHPEVVLACDGSCLSNPGGPTGWAWVREDGTWASGGQPTGTNQVGELWAVLSALRDFPVEPLTIQIDSAYAMKTATTWAELWARNGWVTKEGARVANLSLVQAIHRRMVVRDAPVRFVKVPGHDPEHRFPLNDAADRQARMAAVHAGDHGVSAVFSGADPRVIDLVREARRGGAARPQEREAPLCSSCGTAIRITGDCGCSD